jgi:amidophosphoribosyltransferase
MLDEVDIKEIGILNSRDQAILDADEAVNFKSSPADAALDMAEVDDKARAKCAVFGVFNAEGGNASYQTYYALHAMQHRGQESSGIACYDDRPPKPKIRCHKDFGLVLDVFEDSRILKEQLLGDSAIGHNRYSTAGSDVSPWNVQPFAVMYRDGPLALAHNGNISNAAAIRKRLVHKGTLLQGTTDSELILHLMAQSTKENQLDQLLEALVLCEGAFSLVVLTRDCLFGVRDPNGFRPLVLGKLGNSYMLASETCAFDMLGAEFLREIKPGEVIRIDLDSCKSGEHFSTSLPNHFGISPCVFEHIYFARPDSEVFGESVHQMRLHLGRELAIECPVPQTANDCKEDEVVIIAVPDSSNTAALGYAKACQQAGLKCSYDIGLVRNHYVGRTFIAPNQNSREIKVRCKFNPLKHVVKDKIVVLVDDSIVRGTTSKLLIKMVRKAGAKEVHFRVSSPPVVSPCFYGMDFPSYQELFANQQPSHEAMEKYLGADSLAYLSLEGLKRALKKSNTTYDSYCLACFNKEYPVPIPEMEKRKKSVDW